MWDKLAAIEVRFEEIAHQLSSPEVISDRNLFQKLSREHSDMSELVATIRSHRKAKDELTGAEELVNSSTDAEMASVANE
jgi:peptide chain release factor 1